MKSDIELWKKARNHPAFPAVIGSLVGGVLSTLQALGPFEDNYFLAALAIGLTLGWIGVVTGAFFGFLIPLLVLAGIGRYLGEDEIGAVKPHKILSGVSAFFLTLTINYVIYFLFFQTNWVFPEWIRFVIIFLFVSLFFGGIAIYQSKCPKCGRFFVRLRKSKIRLARKGKQWKITYGCTNCMHVWYEIKTEVLHRNFP